MDFFLLVRDPRRRTDSPLVPSAHPVRRSALYKDRRTDPVNAAAVTYVMVASGTGYESGSLFSFPPAVEKWPICCRNDRRQNWVEKR